MLHGKLFIAIVHLLSKTSQTVIVKEERSSSGDI